MEGARESSGSISREDTTLRTVLRLETLALVKSGCVLETLSPRRGEGPALLPGVTMRRAQAISRKGRSERFGILRDCTPDALHGVKIQSEPHGDMGRPSEMAARLVKTRSFK